MAARKLDGLDGGGSSGGSGSGSGGALAAQKLDDLDGSSGGSEWLDSAARKSNSDNGGGSGGSQRFTARRSVRRMGGSDHNFKAFANAFKDVFAEEITKADALQVQAPATFDRGDGP